MQRIRIAFIGFRHGHILALYNGAKKRADVEIVAACEEDEPTRKEQAAAGVVAITHSSYREMLDQVPCDVVAVGDYFGKRGTVLLEALNRGKHVISDKPICTSLAELAEIGRLAHQKQLSVGCQLDMRDMGILLEVRRRVRGGEIGEVHAISFSGQHPLMWGKRAAWFFEPGKHCGTLNDIGIHAFDAIPWVTGLQFQTINAARGWNASLKQVPHFQDGAQCMLTLNNGGGVLGDVSYLAPDGCGYGIPQYWRFTFWGSNGVLEASYGGKQIVLFRKEAKAPEAVPIPEGRPGAGFDSFLREVHGETADLHLTTAEVLAAARVALRVQEAADKQLTNVPLP